MELVKYAAAKQAIAEYKTVDEVKDFRDKALAVEAYAKQACDMELEMDAALARVRAERRCGQLLEELEKAKGGNPTGKNQYDDKVDAVVPHDTKQKHKTLGEMGITRDQASKWQKLAAVPEEEFEKAVNMPGTKPSTAGILKKKEPANKQPRMDPDALWLWGTLIELEKRAVLSQPLSGFADEMTDAMREDVQRIIPKIKKWVDT